MKILRVAVFGMLALATLGAGWATISGLGTQDPEYPKGISLREQSTRSRHGHAYLFFGGRSHRGGGLSHGK